MERYDQILANERNVMDLLADGHLDDMIQYVIERMVREMMAHPGYQILRQEVDRRGHVLECRVERRSSIQFHDARISITMRDGGEPTSEEYARSRY